MDDEQIPSSLVIAKDVTEEEYLRARRQRTILMTATFGAAMGAAVVWLMAVQFTGLLLQGVILGVATYFVLKQFLEDAVKMGTMKMRLYKDLRLFWKSRAEFEQKKAGQGEG